MVKACRAAPIAEVLAPETPEGQGMTMLDDGLRLVGQHESTMQPTITEFTIFRYAKGFVEASAEPKQVGANREIVGGKELGVFGIGVVVSVNHFDNALARG